MISRSQDSTRARSGRANSTPGAKNIKEAKISAVHTHSAVPHPRSVPLPALRRRSTFASSPLWQVKSGGRVWGFARAGSGLTGQHAIGAMVSTVGARSRALCSGVILRDFEQRCKSAGVRHEPRLVRGGRRVVNGDWEGVHGAGGRLCQRRVPAAHSSSS